MATPRLRPWSHAAAAAVVFVLFVPLSTPAAAAPHDETCPAPFGTALEAGALRFLANGSDPETDIVDTLLMPGAQRSHATVLAFGGRLTLIAEVKVDQGANFTWGVLVRFYSNDTGWNTTPRWASSVDPAVAYPVGFHVRPSPVLWNGSMYIAWTGEGSPAGGATDRLVLVRRVAPDGSMDPWILGSDTDPRRANQHQVLLPAGDTLYLAYSAGEGEPDPAATHIAVRAFDGSSFTPSENITRPPAGWSDELPSLAWDGADTVHAVWTRTNTSGLGALLMHAARNTSGWSPPFEVADIGHATAANPAVAFHDGLLHVAYSTDNPADIQGPDSDVLRRQLDPLTGNWTAPVSLNPQPSGGEDTEPAFSIIGGRLYAGWSTSDDVYAHGDDADPVFRIFEGAQVSPTFELSPPNDNASDGPPRFIEAGGVTYAHFTWTPPVEPGQPRGDTREAVRVVTRPAAWFDGFAAVYSIDAVSENGSVHISLNTTLPAPDSARLVLRLADGSLYPMAREGGKHTAWAPVEPARPDFDVLACGAPITLVPGETIALPRPFNWAYAAAVAGVAGLAVAAYLVARGRKAAPPPPQ